MAKWDVQRVIADNRIIAIRPAGFKGWGRLDGVGKLKITQEELGIDYFDKLALSCEKGGDGLEKSAAALAKEQTIAAVVAEDKAAVLSAVTVADLEAEIAKRVPVDPKLIEEKV